MSELWRRLWYRLNRSRFERELQEEMAAHRAMMGAGAGRFGSAVRLGETSRDEWGWGWLDRLSQDVRFAWRLLWRAPVFTLTAVAVLALGVGVNLAAFQVFETLALSPRPVRSPESLVHFYRRSPRGSSTTLSFPAFEHYARQRSSIGSAMALVRSGVTLGDDTRRAEVEFVTTNYFDELGALPAAGRLLNAGDDAGDAAAVAVLSERVWRAQFGADGSVIGRTVPINGQPFTIVGVVPERFVGLAEGQAAAWIPVAHHRAAFPGSTLVTDWKGASVSFFARLRDGATPAAAEAELRSAANGLRSIRPEHVWADEWLEVRPAGRAVSLTEAGPAFALLGALVGLVLVAACVNLGLLVLARTLGRDREFSIRVSVGATRFRLVRQLLTEHLLLASLGAGAGCFVATQAARAALALSGAHPGLSTAFTVRTLAVAVVLALVASLAFGFAPVWQTLRPAAGRRRRLRSTLIGAQVAAATALLIVSGLLARGVTQVVRVPLGFEYRQTVVADPDLASHGLSRAAAAAYWQRLEPRLRALPGVRSLGLTTLSPFGNRATINDERTVFYHVSPSYFDTLQIALLRGRVFEAGERGVVVVSDALARRRWPGEDPLTKTFDEAVVIGVVADARTVKIREQAATECYRPIDQARMSEAVMVVRSDDAPRRTASAVRQTMRIEAPAVMPSVVLLQDALEDRLQAPRQVTKIVSILGICALLLAVTGLGGMVAFVVSERMREIGVRRALGAGPRHIVGALTRPFSLPVICGGLFGSALAVVVGTILSREMFGVSRLDPVAHGGAFLLFAVVAAAAALPSVHRALRVDPMETLRHD